MTRLAVRVPDALGLKLTPIEQLPPDASSVPQALILLKSPALVPEKSILAKYSLPAPVLFKVSGCAVDLLLTIWEGKLRLVGETDNFGTAPVPDRVTMCGVVL